MVRGSEGEGENSGDTQRLTPNEEHPEEELDEDGGFPSPVSSKKSKESEVNYKTSLSYGDETASTSGGGTRSKELSDRNETRVQDANNVDVEEEDDDKNLPEISYFSLYRYASCCEKLVILIGILMALISGVIPTFSNILFGQFTKVMVEKGSNITQCPPPSSSGTSPFMKAIEDFVIRQCSLGFLAFLLGYLFVMCFNSVAENQVYKIRKEYFGKLLRQEIGWFDKNTKRDFSSRLVEDMLKIQDAISEKVGILLVGIFNSIFLIGVSFYYGWKLSAALMITFPISGAVVAFNANVSSRMTAKEQASYSEAGAVAAEVFTNIKTVNAFNGQDKEAKRFDEKILNAKTVANRKHILVGIGNGLSWGSYYAMYAFAFWYGTHLVLKTRETDDGVYGVDTVLVIFFGVIMASYYLGDSSQYIQAMAEGKGAAKGIFPILNRQSCIDSLSPNGEIPRVRALGKIEFENVEFNYPTRPNVKILRGLNLAIQPGQTLALVGSSGCGKSTCVSLLQRFYDPLGGVIKLDGVDLKDLNISWLRSQSGLVGQEPVLFNASISENISWALDNVSHEEIVKAAKIAYAHEFISQLPLGYDTPAGERGAQLSGGQKQRIAIARALIRNPPILLLDEATSALDFQSESIVQAALERAREGRTTIIVAHRLSTIKAADVVVAIEKGEVRESGTHEELMRREGLYYKLVMSQEDKEELSIIPDELLEEEREMRDTINDDAFEGHVNVGASSPSRIPMRARQISQGSFDDTDTASLVQDSVKIADSSLKKGSIWRLWKLSFKEWPLTLSFVICSVFKGLQLPVYAFIFGRYIQIFTIKDDFEVEAQGDLFAMIFTIFSVFVGACGFFQHAFVGIAGERFTYRIRNLVFSSMLQQDMTFFDESENTVGNLCSRLSTDATSLRGVSSMRLTGLIQAGSIIIASAAMGFYLVPKMSAVTMICVPIILYGSFSEGRVLGSDNVVEKESIEKSCNLAVEALSNMRTVASLCAEKVFMQRYEDALADSHRINKRRAQIRGLVYGFVNSSGFFCYALSVLYGSYLVEHECVSIADVFTVAEALIFCTMSGGAAMAFAPDYDKGKIAAIRILKLLDRVPLVSRFSSSNQIVGEAQGKLEFEKVGFYYRNRPSVRVLRNVDLVSKPGGNIALVGPSGSGKSTCAALILRLYDPSSGKVSFDDVDLKTLNLDQLRQQLAIVSQEPILFDDSLRENIAYGDTSRKVGMEEIIQAARMANIHDFISSLPAGYETQVGALGSQLSGGQKQRVAIARALIRDPKVLLLDEATSALDTESERVVQEALDVAKSGRTCITIAHRLTSIQNSDQIIVMKNGCVREIGTHSELLSTEGGLYRDMWLAQKLQSDENTD